MTTTSMPVIFECEYCHSELSSQASLDRHQQTAKYCLNEQKFLKKAQITPKAKVGKNSLKKKTPKIVSVELIFPVTIIQPGVCLVRGISSRNLRKPTRYYGYFGNERDAQKFCKSKKFIQKYAQDEENIDYYVVYKSLHLIKIPYMAMSPTMTPTLAVEIMTIATSFWKYVKQEETKKTKDRRPKDLDIELTKNDIITFCFGFQLEEVGDNLQDDQKTEIVNEILNFKSTDGSVNPDYTIDKLACALGLNGWVRINPDPDEEIEMIGDELMVCNYGKGSIRLSKGCNLSKKCD